MGVAAIGAVVLWAGCRDPEPGATAAVPAGAVAVVGRQIITGERFQAELDRRARMASGRVLGAGDKRAVLEEMIRWEVLYERALEAGYDRDPQIVAGVKRMIAGKFQEDQRAKDGPAPATAGEIADFHRNNPQRFGTPERVRAALIQIEVARTAAPARRAEAAARAEAVLAAARTNASPGGGFGALAQRHSAHQASRYRGGDIGWLAAGEADSAWPSAVREAVFKLGQPGDLSPVIEAPGGFYVMKLLERQPARVRPLEEVRDGVAYWVARQKEQEWEEAMHASLKQGLDIRINGALLESLAVPTRELRPPGVPGGAAVRVRGGGGTLEGSGGVGGSEQ